MGYSPFYFLGQAFKNLKRNCGTAIASMLVLVACLLVTGTFYALNENINYNLEGVGGLNRILVYINEDCTDSRIREIKEQAQQLKNAASVRLITKEEALEDEMNKLGEENEDLFKWLEEGENPYRASLEVEYKNGDRVAELEEQLGAIDGVDSVASRNDLALKVNNVKTAVSRVFLGMVALLLAVSIFVIVTTVRLALANRRKEIEVMRYVGATGFFITTPFLTEGVLIGLFSSLIAFGLQQYLYSLLSSGAGKNLFGLVSFLPASHFTGPLGLLFLAVGVGAGLLGSAISLGRYLKA